VESFPNPDTSVPRSFHHDSSTAFGKKFDVCPPEPAACASHNRDLPLKRDSFSHLLQSSDSDAALRQRRVDATPNRHVYTL
jgi:hypothetical protein